MSEALLYGAWMLGQGTAFFPNYSTAKIAAGKMLHIIDRKPRIYSSQATGSSAWVSYILSCHSVTVKWSKVNNINANFLQFSVNLTVKKNLEGELNMAKIYLAENKINGFWQYAHQQTVYILHLLALLL